MSEPCFVKVNGHELPGILVAYGDRGDSATICFRRDELQPDQRALLGWKGHNKECYKVFSVKQVMTR